MIDEAVIHYGINDAKLKQPFKLQYGYTFCIRVRVRVCFVEIFLPWIIVLSADTSSAIDSW